MKQSSILTRSTIIDFRKEDINDNKRNAGGNPPLKKRKGYLHIGA